MPDGDQTTAVLYNEPILTSLPVVKLRALCKDHGLKTGGKKDELQERLRDHGRMLREGGGADEEGEWSMLDDSRAEGQEDEVNGGESSNGAEGGMRNESVLDEQKQGFSLPALMGRSNSNGAISSSNSSRSLTSSIRTGISTFIDRLGTSTSTSTISALPAPVPNLESEAEQLEQLENTTFPLPTSTSRIYPSLPDWSTLPSASPPPAPHPTASETFPFPHPSSLDLDVSIDHSFGASTVNRSIDANTTTEFSSPRRTPGGIRLVDPIMDNNQSSPTRSLSSPAKPAMAIPARAPVDITAETSKPAFVFGSPTGREQKFEFAGFSLATPSINTPSEAATDGSSPMKVPGFDAEKEKSAVESILAEMNRRVAEKAGAGGMKRSASTFDWEGRAARKAEEEKGKKGEFASKHKRGFDRMDGIDTHYAAKRTLKASASTHGLSTSSSSTALARSPKRLKVAASPEKRIADSLRADGWVAPEPWNRAHKEVLSGRKEAMSNSSSVGIGGSGIVGRDEERKERERREKRREMERKVRRASMAANGGRKSSGRRRSTIVGRQSKPATGNVASRLLKSTFNKIKASTSSEKISSFASASTSTSARPASTSTSGSVFSRLTQPTAASIQRSRTTSNLAEASVTMKPAVPPRTSANGAPKPHVAARPKFNLQESLKAGTKKYRPVSISTSPSLSKLGSSTSSLARSTSLTRASSIGPASAPGLVRRPSARVANSTLLSAVKPQPARQAPPAHPPSEEVVDEVVEKIGAEVIAEVKEVDDEKEYDFAGVSVSMDLDAPVDEDKENAVQEQEDDHLTQQLYPQLVLPGTTTSPRANALSADAHTIPVASASAIFGPSTTSSTLLATPAPTMKSTTPLGSPSSSSIPFRPITSPALKSPTSTSAARRPLTAGGRKIVSSASKAARDGGKREEKIRLESKARMVVARRDKGKAREI